jgi:signal transduction histidine kinase
MHVQLQVFLENLISGTAYFVFIFPPCLLVIRFGREVVVQTKEAGMMRARFHHVLVLAGLAVAYWIAGKLGLQLAFVHPSATAVWPPTGLTLAALLLLGYRVWPGIFLGAYLVNISTAGSIATSLGLAVGNTLEGLVGAYLVNRFANGRNAFDRPQDVFTFALLAGLVSTSVSATIGVTSLSLGGYADWANYGAIWLTWWLGDAAGDLILAPLLILWATRLPAPWHRAQVLEVAALGLLLVLVGQAVFGGIPFDESQKYPLEFLCLPLLVWTALRFGQREVALATFLIAGIAVWGTLRGYGPFARGTAHESLLLLQAFMGTSAMIAMSVVAAVNEYRQTEVVCGEEQRQSRKMVAIGRLAGGIAHDFNNILTVIGGYSSMLMDTGSLRGADRSAIEEIAQATRRASSLTAQLLAFSRRQLVQPIALNLNEVVSAIESMLRRLIGADIVFRTVLAPSLGPVNADPSQVDQVLLNMVVNARDAMPQGGRLTIETGNVELDEAFVRQHAGSRAGSHVMLAVTDTGVGMDGATKARMFEPFFTTKGPGKGTGLGLATVYGIVKQSGGYVTVDSEPGSGAMFKVYFPRGDDPLSSDEPLMGDNPSIEKRSPASA